MTRILASLTLFLLVGCGGDSPRVGGTCSAAGDCDDGLMCDTTVSGGLCTRTCATSGEQSDCPSGALCDTLGDDVVCLKSCDDDADCRPDHACTGISGGSGKACHPKDDAVDAGAGVADAGQPDA